MARCLYLTALVHSTQGYFGLYGPGLTIAPVSPHRSNRSRMVCLFRVCGLLYSSVEFLVAARAWVMSVFVCESCLSVFGVLVSVCVWFKSCACSVRVMSVVVAMRKARRVIQWRLDDFLTFRCWCGGDLSSVVAFVLVWEAAGSLGQACSDVLVGVKT